MKHTGRSNKWVSSKPILSSIEAEQPCKLHSSIPCSDVHNQPRYKTAIAILVDRIGIETTILRTILFVIEPPCIRCDLPVLH